MTSAERPAPEPAGEPAAPVEVQAGQTRPAGTTPTEPAAAPVSVEPAELVGRADWVDRVDLGDGRELVVRAVSIADVDELVELYAALSLQDRYRRFFSAYRPNRDVVRRWATVAERGGYGLVAEVTEPGGARHIVADASYALLADGDGELAITVSAGWRGWLAPYLLDLLVEAAHQRGVPNLQAEVLTENLPMLALVRARGFAVLAHPDWTVVRVSIGTGQRVPSWPAPVGGGPRRPRVLVEVAGARWRCEDLVRRAGVDVMTCPGPPADRPERCPLLSGGRCPLVEGADAIVVALRPSDPATVALLDAHRAGPATTPVLVLGEAHDRPESEVEVVLHALRDRPAGHEAAT